MKLQKIKLKITNEKIEIKENGVPCAFFDRKKRAIYRVDVAMMGAENVHVFLGTYDEVVNVGFGIAKIRLKYGENYCQDCLAIEFVNGDKMILVACNESIAKDRAIVLLEELEIESDEDIGAFTFELKISPDSIRRVIIAVSCIVVGIASIPFIWWAFHTPFTLFDKYKTIFQGL
ncbi:MAG: hypothetical protein COB02_03090 [Candidatus Cloacimonadota bacterium]|nr:MAG: hypothetical protein COB02_03090 [Candidatus Cloacimonadota bacterium]